ncbi:CMGC/SRPK protein kinase [Apiospora phragmitis]|uniref:non-specific serine/threonine protein kinase n=1 Tax=Apiospora phragmitis TaxID=2905665 RepID=A0ABR1TBB0_9PEZI
MSAPTVEYGYVNGIEDLSDYRSGGYHPVHIDDRLDKRYHVVYKLGHGTFSTAWLALDEETSRFVAVKVGTADTDRTEVDILSQLTHSRVSGYDSEDSLPLTDFGVAFRPDDKSRFESYTPLVLRPPEAFFEPTTPLTYASDIWSLGCVIFELLAHRSLIDGFLAPQDEIITAQQVELQGLMPPEWWEKWEKRPKWYDNTGKPLTDKSEIWPWERRFEEWVQSPRNTKKMGTILEDEWDALLKLLKRMLAWRPSERPNIREVLEADWMTGWALPTYRTGLKGQLTLSNEQV